MVMHPPFWQRTSSGRHPRASPPPHWCYTLSMSLLRVSPVVHKELFSWTKGCLTHYALHGKGGQRQEVGGIQDLEQAAS